MFSFGSDEISRVSMALMRYVQEPRWNAHLMAAENEAFGRPEDFSDGMRAVRASMACEEAFLTWFAVARPIDKRDTTPVDCFLQEFSTGLTPLQRSYLEGVRTSCLRPYEVLAGKRGENAGALRDLWSDEIIPLSARAPARGIRGAGMAFARVIIGTNGMPEVLEALAIPKAEMHVALLRLRMLHQAFPNRTAASDDDVFFSMTTPWMLRTWLTSFAPQRKGRPGKRIVQVKVILDDVRPQIWRRLLIPEDMNLASMSATLERAMGWRGYHLHEMYIDGVAYGTPDPESPRPVHSEHDRHLGDFDLEKGAGFQYCYDFGDGWSHRVVIERYLEPEPDLPYPRCIDGARACPPEDVGGPGGYRDFLKVLSNPKHQEHRTLKSWARRNGRAFDPECFDIAAVNRRLRGRVIVSS